MVGSGWKGPEAMTEGSFPGTSERRRAWTRAWVARRALPPLIRERCLRTAFTSWMLAPLFRRASVRARFSSRETPKGAHHRALPPPETRAKTRALGERPWRRLRTSLAARTLSSSGTGWRARTALSPRGSWPLGRARW